MPVTELSVRHLKSDYPGISVFARRTVAARRTGFFRRFLDFLIAMFARQSLAAAGDVVAIRVTVSGIRGGGRRDRQNYELILDVTQLDSQLPKAWVVSPPDPQIRHVNIWPATQGDGLCPWLGVQLPSLCWFRFKEAWSSAPPQSRTLGSALEFTKQLLNTENHDSPAR